MIDIDWGRLKTEPFAATEHQKDGVRALLKYPAFALFDDPGTSKSRQVVDAACFMFEAGMIDTALVFSPASVRIVWGSELGEVEKWAFAPCAIHEFHAKTPDVAWKAGRLNWVVSNYEFLISGTRLRDLQRQLKGRKVLIILDESSRIKSHKSQTTRACIELRNNCCDRAVVLNGTPVANSPLDLFSQMEFLDPRIIGCANFFHFRSRYARMGGYKSKQIIGYQNLEELNERIRPYVLRRTLDDCVQLPPRDFQLREARLEPRSWKLYREMRDGMVAWLDGQPSVAPQAVVKILRLSQLTSGFLGGFETEESAAHRLEDLDAVVAEPGSPEWSAALAEGLTAAGAPKKVYAPPKEVGREKLDAFLEFFDAWQAANPGDRIIVWGRFRAELDRAQAALEERGVRCVQVRGGQTKTEREEAVKVFTKPGTDETMALFGSPQAGGLGLTLIEAATVFYMSNDYNLLTREQSEGRVRRRGQKRRMTYVDLVATGPAGQKTIDHTVIKALREKRNLAEFTTAEWRKALTEE